MRSTIAHAQQIAYRARRFIDSPVGFTEEVKRLAANEGLEPRATAQAGHEVIEAGVSWEVADLLLFLCGESGNYISGSEIHIDGGQRV